MRIRTLMDARRAIADCMGRDMPPLATFEVTMDDWRDMLNALTGFEPVALDNEVHEPTIAGIPVVVVD